LESGWLLESLKNRNACGIRFFSPFGILPIFCAAQELLTAEPGQIYSSRHPAFTRRTLDKSAVKEDARMRLQGQHVPEAPCTAHGQMSFVFSAPVCLFPVPPPAGQLKIRVVQPSIRFPGFSRGPLPG